MRILVTGSRTWDDRNAIHDALTTSARLHLIRHPEVRNQVTVVHGGARGADRIAAEWTWNRLGTTAEEHRADWALHGRSAGHRRNADMVKLGADLCLAFIRDASRGATGCADLAEAAGIPTIWITWEDRAEAAGVPTVRIGTDGREVKR